MGNSIKELLNWKLKPYEPKAMATTYPKHIPQELCNTPISTPKLIDLFQPHSIYIIHYLIGQHQQWICIL